MKKFMASRITGKYINLEIMPILDSTNKDKFIKKSLKNFKLLIVTMKTSAQEVQVWPKSCEDS